MGEAPRWFQLYWPRSDELAASFVGRAERAGFGAIVVTVDTYLLAWRERDIRNAYLPFLRGDGLANYFTDPVFRQAVGGDPRRTPSRTFEYFVAGVLRPVADLGRPRAAAAGDPAADPHQGRAPPRRCAEGGRPRRRGRDRLQPRRPPARRGDRALDALPRVVDAVGDRTTVLFDSGIRRGSDVLKALALGARAVLLGRPYAYGLAVAGEQGVRDVLAEPDRRPRPGPGPDRLRLVRGARAGEPGRNLGTDRRPLESRRGEGGTLMRSERDKMLAGELYDPLDPELVAARHRARDLCQALNATREADEAERRRILGELFGAGGDSVWMQPPFFCDYGSNILLGERVFFNFNCVVLDVCRVTDRRLTRCSARRCRSTPPRTR